MQTGAEHGTFYEYISWTDRFATDLQDYPKVAWAAKFRWRPAVVDPSTHEGWTCMNLVDLFEGRFDAYFDDAQAGDPLWLFVHVPKTAGSSLNGELVPILFPNHHIFIDYTVVGKSFDELIDESVDRFIALAQAKNYRYCTGHIYDRHVQKIVGAVPRVRPVTLLREPVSRFISDYRYQRSSMHPGNEDFRAAYPRIEDYLALEGDWNKAASYLLPTELRRNGDVQACVNYLIATYGFIGIQEMYSLSLHTLTWFAGVPKRSKIRKRINNPTPDNDVDLTYDLQQKIKSKNALDVAIYEAISPRLMNVSDNLAKYLDRVAPRPPRP